MDGAIKDELDFSTLEVGYRHAVIEVNEGVELDLDKYNRLMERIAVEGRFPVVLIFDDIHSYSVSLKVLMALQQDARVCCVAAVAYRSATHNVYRFARDVTGKVTRFFNSRQQALAEVGQMLGQNHAA